MYSQISIKLIFCRLMEQIYPKPPKRPKKGEPKPEFNRNPEIEKIIKKIVKNFRIIMKKK